MYSPLSHFGDYVLCWSATKWSVSGMSITPRGPMPGLAMASTIKPLKGDVWSMMSCKGEEILIYSSWELLVWTALFSHSASVHQISGTLCIILWQVACFRADTWETGLVTGDAKTCPGETPSLTFAALFSRPQSKTGWWSMVSFVKNQ